VHVAAVILVLLCTWRPPRHNCPRPTALPPVRWSSCGKSRRPAGPLKKSLRQVRMGRPLRAQRGQNCALRTVPYRPAEHRFGLRVPRWGTTSAALC